ncbi:MAG: PKD domain-containing protein [Aureispira sp.]|nr:PKD domain-containing protein [Aureispira sp.]
MKQRPLLLSLLLLILLPLSGYATHMVGGEVNYRCLGNDQYEISVTVFRDCDTGVPWFDNPASIGIFNSNDSLIYDVRMSLQNNDTLEITLFDPCFVAPPNVCIHTTTYVDTVTLPFLAGGYQVVYQRCCRNQDIVNIVNPLGTGTTYSSYISEEALLGCNSSATFKEWPPVYICQGVPIVYDHSAFDVDGDSVVYELCNPLTGASPSQSMPQPPYNPPYDSVVWLPPYSVDNMLGGPDSLKIDPNTGLLTGTPNTLGVFVVGVCAKEYRNGVLISTTKRDFQYVIGVCGRKVVSSFFAPQIQCDNSLTVAFQNNSQTLGTGYSWYFGDTTTQASSTLANPAYIYPDTGLYTITLIADPGSQCADTFVQDVYLQYESILSDFEVNAINCADTLALQVTDLTIDTISTIAQWHWTFGNGQTASIPYASTTYDTSGTYIITLDVLAANGCVGYHDDTISISLPKILSSDTVGICDGQTSIILNPDGDTTHQYQWSPGTGLSGTTIASPLASPLTTTTYNVTVTAFNGIDTCVLQRSVTVVVSPPLDVTLPNDSITCLDSITLYANTSGPAQIEWSHSPFFIPVVSTQNPETFALSGITSFYVRATDPYGCTAEDTMYAMTQNIPIVANFSHSRLNCADTMNVQFTDLTTDTSRGAIISWLWDFDDGDTSHAQNPMHTFTQSGSYLVSLTVISDKGCTGTIQQLVNILLPEITSADTVGICDGSSSVVLNPGGDPLLNYQWSPATGLSSTTSASPTASPTVPTTYTVTITAINGLDTCTDIKDVHVLFAPPITVDVPTQQQYCGSTVTLTATSSTAVLYEWSGDLSFNNILAVGNPVTVIPLTTPFSGYYVRATDAYGCTATDFVIVEQLQTPINVDFIYQPLTCSKTMSVQFTDITSDTASSSIVSWAWTTSDNQTSAAQNPVFTFTQSQNYNVGLTVTLANGCTGSIDYNMNFNIANLRNDTIVPMCDGTSSIILNDGGDTDLIYNWSGAGLSSTTATSPTVTPPTTPYTYTVTITGFNGPDTCTSVQDVTITSPPPITLNVPKDTIFCTNLYYVEAETQNVSTIEWAFNPSFSPVAISGTSAFYISLPSPPFDYSIYVRAFDDYGCMVHDTVRLHRRDIPVPVDFSYQIDDCTDTLEVRFTDLTVPATPISSWDWTFGNGLSSSVQNPSTTYTQDSTYNVINLTVTLGNGCVGTAVDSFMYLIPTITSSDSVGLCSGSSVVLNPGGNPNLTYDWTPATGLSSSTAASPIASPTSTTTYTVKVTAYNPGDTCVLVKDITVGADNFVFDAMPDTNLCANQIDLYVNSPTANNVEWAIDRDFNLLLGSGNPFTTNVNGGRWFYARGQNSFGCKGLDSVYVYARNSLVLPDFSMSPVRCGDSLEVAFQDLTTEPNILNWNWILGNGETSVAQNPTAVYDSAGVYNIRLDVTVPGGCVGSLQKQIQLAVPKLDVPNDTIVCFGDSVTLNRSNISAGLTYEWAPSTGLDNPNIASPKASPNSTTTYTVTVTSYPLIDGVVDTCVIVDSIQIGVTPPIQLQLTGDTALCQNSFNLNAASVATIDYEWATDIGFSTIINTTDTYNSILQGQQQRFYVRAADSIGCTQLDSIDVELREANVQVDSALLSCGPNNLLDITAQNLNSGDALTYQWSPIANINSGQGTDSITTLATTTGVIELIVTNQFGCKDTAQTNITVAPTLAVDINADTVACDSLVALNAVSANANSYEWALDATFLTIIGNTAALNQNIDTTNGAYYLQVQDTFGCVATDSIQIQTEYVNISGNTVVKCTSDPIGLKVNNLNLGSNLSYQWTSSSQILSGQGTDSITTNPSTTTDFEVVATNQYGCTDTTIISVTVPPVLTVNITSDTVACSPEVTLNALSPNANNYQWSLTNDYAIVIGSNANLIQNLDTTSGIYYLRVQDAFGCTAGDSLQLITHYVSITADSTILKCTSDPIQLTATNLNPNTNLTYQWSPSSEVLSGQGSNNISTNPTTDTNFEIIASNGLGCSDTAYTQVQAPQPLDLDMPNDTTLCQPEIGLVASASGANSYQWSLSPTFDTVIYTIDSLNLVLNTTEQTYYLAVENSSGCRIEDSVQLTLRNAAIELDSLIQICENEEVILVASNLNANDQLSYEWSPDTAIITGQGTAAIITKPTETTSFGIVATNQYGCQDNASAIVEVVSAIPPLAIISSHDTVLLGQSAQLEATDDNSYIYTWEQANSLSSWTVYNPIATPEENTTYHLTVTNSFGCVNSDSITLYSVFVLCGEPAIFVPNAFTPNNDGANDILYVRGNNITDVYFTVYNRWGEMMFETTDQNIGWDGTYKGKKLPPDAYGYYLQCKCLDGSEFTKRGNVTIIR